MIGALDESGMCFSPQAGDVAEAEWDTESSNMPKETGRFSMYSYSTMGKQHFRYTFRPMVEPAFARALDRTVVKAVGNTPGRYTVNVNGIEVKRKPGAKLTVSLRSHTSGQDIQTSLIAVPGWEVVL